MALMWQYVTKLVAVFAVAATMAGCADGTCVQVETSVGNGAMGCLTIRGEFINGTSINFFENVCLGDRRVSCIDNSNCELKPVLYASNPTTDGWRGSIRVSSDNSRRECCTSATTVECISSGSNCLSHDSTLNYPNVDGGDTTAIWLDGDATSAGSNFRASDRTYCLHGVECGLDIASFACTLSPTTSEPTFSPSAPTAVPSSSAPTTSPSSSPTESYAVGSFNVTQNLTCGGTVTGDTSSLTNVGGNGAPDAFLYVLISVDDPDLTYVIDGCGSSFDTIFRILDPINSNQVYTCDDCGGCDFYQTRITILPVNGSAHTGDLSPGEDQFDTGTGTPFNNGLYILAVDGYDFGYEGAYSITMTCFTPSPTTSSPSAPTTSEPTLSPTLSPTSAPTTSAPTLSPTLSPTSAPTTSPTVSAKGKSAKGKSAKGSATGKSGAKDGKSGGAKKRKSGKNKQPEASESYSNSGSGATTSALVPAMTVSVIIVIIGAIVGLRIRRWRKNAESASADQHCENINEEAVF